MKKLVFIAVAVLVAVGAVAMADDSEDAKIKACALDYVDGWYTGDGERMENALHPRLAKRIVREREDGRSRLDDMSALELVQGARAGWGKNTPVDQQQRDVVILDKYENVASVKATMHGWVDYIHMAKYNGKWKIVNVLWELKPKTE